MNPTVNFLSGMTARVIFDFILTAQKNKHEQTLAMLKAKTKHLKAQQEFLNSPDNWTKYTRRIIAITLVGTYCIILLYQIINCPDKDFIRSVQYYPSFLKKWLWGSSEITTIKVSTLALICDLRDLVEIVIGCYFGGKVRR